jgi:hypothetical protein
VEDWAEFDLFFLETPISGPTISTSTQTAERAHMKIAAG